jgi:hypothetical protein
MEKLKISHDNFTLSQSWAQLPLSIKKQRWVPALFRIRECEAKKERESAKKKKREKSESAERERKKARIRAFSPTHSGNPVLEPKAARQWGK